MVDYKKYSIGTLYTIMHKYRPTINVQLSTQRKYLIDIITKDDILCALPENVFDLIETKTQLYEDYLNEIEKKSMILSILNENPYKGYVDYLVDGYEAIDSGNETMPFKFFPDSMPHGESQNAWDKYENNKFDEECPQCEKFWSNVLRLAKTIRKLDNAKNIDPEIDDNEFIEKECKLLS